MTDGPVAVASSGMPTQSPPALDGSAATILVKLEQISASVDGVRADVAAVKGDVAALKSSDDAIHRTVTDLGSQVLAASETSKRSEAKSDAAAAAVQTLGVRVEALGATVVAHAASTAASASRVVESNASQNAELAKQTTLLQVLLDAKPATVARYTAQAVMLAGAVGAVIAAAVTAYMHAMGH